MNEKLTGKSDKPMPKKQAAAQSMDLREHGAALGIDSRWPSNCILENI
jgi:hypothetical protein